MRYLERRPVRTKLQKKVVAAVNILPESITADEVSFGTVVTTPETDINNVVIENPKDGLLVISTTDGSSSIYSGDDSIYYAIADPVAQGDADQAAADAAAAAADAAAAQADAEQAAADAAAADAAATAAQEDATQALVDAAAAEAAAAAASEEAAAASEEAAAAEAAAAAASEEAAAADAKAAAASEEAAAAEAAAAAADAKAADAASAAADADAAAAQAAADAAAASQEAAQGIADAAQAAADAAQAAADAAQASLEAAQGIADAAAADAAAADAQAAADAAALDAEDALAVANNAVDDAAAAAASALGASESANKKNSVFRSPASAYTAPTYNPAGQPLANAIGDVWFDTTPLTNDNGAGGAKPKRWNGTIWEPFGLSYAAITSLDADTITAGTLTGRTVRTSASGNRIELVDTDVLKFWKDDTTLVGTIQPGLLNQGLVLTAGSGGSTISMTGSDWASDSTIIIATSQSAGSIIMFDDTYDGESGGGMFITGNSLVIQGTNGWDIKDAASSAVIYGQGGDISIQGGGAAIDLSGGDISLGGSLVLGYGTYVSGTGTPTAAATDGTIIFKYT
jgi:hypothetical protein